MVKITEIEQSAANLVMVPYGVKMSNTFKDASPFPHRNGNLYMLFQGLYWDRNTPVVTQKNGLAWLRVRSLSKDLTPYVSGNPKSSYVNYNDLELGVGHLLYYTIISKHSTYGWYD